MIGAMKRHVRAFRDTRQLIVVLSAALLASACARASTSATPSATASSWSGATIVRAVQLPNITLTDTAGQPFNLRQRGVGKFTLLYFGYTHCPDACPATMATLTLALRSLPAADRNQAQVIFVTTDPGRDTGPVLKTWLAQFEPTFIGLTGTNAQIEEAQGLTHLPNSQLDSPDASGGYAVEHSAFLLAFTADGLAHITYPGGVSSTDEARDFQRLIEHGFQ